MHEMTRCAESVRDRCIEAALHAYEEAGISGLIAELNTPNLLVQVGAGSDW